MPAESQTQPKYNTPLRQAQREFTRNRIKSAARNLFYERHYDTTTMDEIAIDAGLRRSTLYVHYKDKGEILLDLIADYTPRAKAVLASLRGPHPTEKELLQWIKRVARFVSKERAPLSIIVEYRTRHKDDMQLEAMTYELLAAIGTNNPIFLEAAQPKADPLLQARGLMLLQELTYACSSYLEAVSAPRGLAILQVAAQDFHAFLTSSTEISDKPLVPPRRAQPAQS